MKVTLLVVCLGGAKPSAYYILTLEVVSTTEIASVDVADLHEYDASIQVSKPSGFRSSPVSLSHWYHVVSQCLPKSDTCPPPSISEPTLSNALPTTSIDLAL